MEHPQQREIVAYCCGQTTHQHIDEIEAHLVYCSECALAINQQVRLTFQKRTFQPVCME
jgi:hypothetical protein